MRTATVCFLVVVLRANGWAEVDEIPLTKLNLTLPALSRVRAATDAGDADRAAAELLSYFRQRTAPQWYFAADQPPPPKPGAADAAAEKVLRREYAFVGKPATLTHDLDWNANPLNDVEWPIELNRHYTWVALGRGYWNTGNERYAADFVYQLRDWVNDNPRPTSPRGGRYTWRTLECGIRLSGSWPETFYRFVNSPSFTPEVLSTMLGSMWEQADYLAKFPSGGGNWLVAESAGLVTFSILFPEFTDSAQWQKLAFDRLSQEMDRQVLPDGAQVELTPHYHSATLGSFLAATRIAQLNGVPLPGNFGTGLERMFAYLAYVAKPDGYIPMFNDSDHDDAYARLRGEPLVTRPDLRWVLTGGKEGAAPGFASLAFPWAGQYVMRSGWDRDALYLAMDAGPYGLGHQHEDKLQVDVHAYGRSHILDPGRFTYAGRWRGHFVSTAAHSTLLVDGTGQNRRRTPSSTWVTDHPLPNRWLTNDDFDFAAGSYADGYGKNDDVLHVRKVFFARPDYWIVTDLLLGRDGYTGEHEAAVQYQFGAPGATADEKPHLVCSHNEDANLAVLPLAARPLEVDLHEGEDNPPAGWIGWSLHRALKEPATMAVFRQKGAVPTQLDCLLFPYRGADLPPVRLEALPEHGTKGSALRISTAEWTDYYYCAHSEGGAARFGDFETDADLTWVRTDAAGKVVKAVSEGGSYLRRGGAQVAGSGQLSPSPVTKDGEGRTVEFDSAKPGKAVLDYGYADGGGYLFRVEQDAQPGHNTVSLPDLLPELRYVYRLRVVADGRTQVVQRGRLRLPPPRKFDFEDGTTQGWEGAVEVDKLGANGSAGALHLASDPATEAQYVSATLAARFTVRRELAISFVYRAPLAAGGDWCYTKLTLQDRDGMDWSAYFARAPIRDWQKVALTLADFRGDTRDHPEQQGKPLPVGTHISRISFTQRKGVTTQPVAAELWVDDVRLAVE